MVDETKRIYHGTTTTLEGNGASLTSGGTPAAANDATLDLGGYTAPADYPHVRFVFTGTFSTSTGIENKVIELIAQELDVDGTKDTEAPTASFRHKVVESFPLKNVTSAQTIVVDVYDAPRKANYHIYQASGQTLSAGWVLKATPFTYGPVPA